MSLLTWWWRRKVIVERVEEDRDVFVVAIDAGDGSLRQEIVVPRNDLCSIAWLLVRTRDWTQLTSLTWRPGGVDAPEVEVIIPTWARSTLTVRVVAAARSVGWRGEVYQPHRGGPFR